MEEAQIEKWFEKIDKKIDKLLELETRVAVLEAKGETHDAVAAEITTLRSAAGLRDEVVSLRARLEVIERVYGRYLGITDGVKLVWVVLAGTPGAAAVAAMWWWYTHK